MPQNRKVWTVKMVGRGWYRYLNNQMSCRLITDAAFSPLGPTTSLMAKQAADNWASTLNKLRSGRNFCRGIKFEAVKIVNGKEV